MPNQLNVLSAQTLKCKLCDSSLPPQPECAPAWRSSFLAQMPNIQLTLLIGVHAQKWHLPEHRQMSLTQRVQNWREYWPSILPLPHPSPRNNIWLKKNSWFVAQVIPHLQTRVQALIR